MYFSVAVISKTPEDVARLMAPFQENNLGTCPAEYLRFIDVEDQYRQRYESEGTTMVKLPDDSMCLSVDERFRVKDPLSFENYRVPAEYEQIEMAFKDVYPTFDLFMERYAEIGRGENGRYGYTGNPNAKWEAWEIGGRYRYAISATCGACAKPNDKLHHIPPAGRFDVARIRDVIPGPDPDIYRQAKTCWEICRESRYLKQGESLEIYRHGTPKVDIGEYDDKEEYCRHMASLSAYAILQPDGTWFDCDETNSYHESRESIRRFEKHFFRAVQDAGDSCCLTIVCCHV